MRFTAFQQWKPIHDNEFWVCLIVLQVFENFRIHGMIAIKKTCGNSTFVLLRTIRAVYSNSDVCVCVITFTFKTISKHK